MAAKKKHKKRSDTKKTTRVKQEADCSLDDLCKWAQQMATPQGYDDTKAPAKGDPWMAQVTWLLLQLKNAVANLEHQAFCSGDGTAVKAAKFYDCTGGGPDKTPPPPPPAFPPP